MRQDLGGLVHALLKRLDPLLVIAPDFCEIGIERLEPVPILFRHPKHVCHLSLERVEALIERRNRRLRCSRLIQEPRGICGTPLWEHLSLQLI